MANTAGQIRQSASSNCGRARAVRAHSKGESGWHGGEVEAKWTRRGWTSARRAQWDAHQFLNITVQRRLLGGLVKSRRLSRTCLMSCTCADRTSISTALAFGSTSVEMRTTDRRLFAPRDGLIKLTLSMSISSSISFLSHKKSFFFCHERHESCSRCRLVPRRRDGS